MSEKLKAMEFKLNALSSRVNVLRRKEENAMLRGGMKDVTNTYWRYRNCYSCPQGDADYWWLYRKILGICSLKDCTILVLDIQIDKDGKLMAERRTVAWGSHTSMGYQRSNKKEFAHAVVSAKALLRAGI